MEVSIFESQRPFFFLTSLGPYSSWLSGGGPWVTEMQGESVSKYHATRKWDTGISILLYIIIEECAERD